MKQLRSLVPHIASCLIVFGLGGLLTDLLSGSGLFKDLHPIKTPTRAMLLLEPDLAWCWLSLGLLLFALLKWYGPNPFEKSK